MYTIYNVNNLTSGTYSNKQQCSLTNLNINGVDFHHFFRSVILSDKITGKLTAIYQSM